MEPLPEFRLVRPTAARTAVTLHQRHARSRYIAGGTDLVVNLRHGLVEPKLLIDLSRIAALQGIAIAEQGWLKIGTGVTLAEIAADPAVTGAYPALAAAALSVGGPGHRLAGTLGGNLCLDTRCVFYNQSAWWRAANHFCLKYKGKTCHVAPTGGRCHAAFSGDLAPALLALGAEVEIEDGSTLRRLPLAELYADDGAKHLRLNPGELVTAAWLPPDPIPSAYDKVRLRGAVDFPLAGVAVALKRDGEAMTALRVALTGTNSRPFLLDGTAELVGSALDQVTLARLDRLVQRQVSPMRTTLAASHYRRRAAAALAKRLALRLYGG